MADGMARVLARYLASVAPDQAGAVRSANAPDTPSPLAPLRGQIAVRVAGGSGSGQRDRVPAMRRGRVESV